jgi:hypothetical protein
MHQFTRPQEARQIEARSRARELGVRVRVIGAGRSYETPSQSQPGTTYVVTRTPIGWTCDCPGFPFTGCCKHLGQVERRSEREGWSFGRVAPRPQVVA